MIRRIYGWLALVLGAIAAVLLYGRGQKREGRQEGANEVRRRAQVAAEGREAIRNEIDDSVSDGGAVERLRNDWSRD